MNYSNFNISLDVHQPGSQVWLTAKQGETARKIYISLTESGAPYEIAEGVTPVFAAKKADGNIIFNNCSFEGSQIVYEVTAQTTAALGKLDCSIKLYGADSKLLISPRFVINIVPDVYTDSEFIESVTEVNTLTSLIVEAMGLLTAAEDGLFVPKISIGTVTTLPAGSNATASFTGDFREPVLNLGIPQGPQGQAESLIPDTALSTESTKPVQNKVIAKAINDVLEAVAKKADASALTSKVDKVSGKGLSANDFTNAYKTKLDGIEAGANKYVLADKSVTTAKLGDGSVTNAKLAASSVGTSKLIDASVTAAKMAKNAIFRGYYGFVLNAADWVQNEYGSYEQTKKTTGYGFSPDKHVGFLGHSRGIQAYPGDNNTAWGWAQSSLKADKKKMACLYSAKLIAEDTIKFVASKIPDGTLYVTILFFGR